MVSFEIFKQICRDTMSFMVENDAVALFSVFVIGWKCCNFVQHQWLQLMHQLECSRKQNDSTESLVNDLKKRLQEATVTSNISSANSKGIAGHTAINTFANTAATNQDGLQETVIKDIGVVSGCYKQCIGTPRQGTAEYRS